MKINIKRLPHNFLLGLLMSPFFVLSLELFLMSFHVIPRLHPLAAIPPLVLSFTSLTLILIQE